MATHGNNKRAAFSSFLSHRKRMFDAMTDELRILQLRYGGNDLGTPLTRLRMKQNRNLARREAIESQIAELAEESDRLTEEHRRMSLLERELVGEIADQIRERRGEGWSPTPVVGYRIWEIVDDGLVGATGFRWERPAMEATCARARSHDDLPHTDHTCSTVGHGCGIYAAYHPSLLPSLRAAEAAVGVIQMSGKVVEHEHGYRAAHARVAGVVAHAGGRLLVTSSHDIITALFADPRPTLERHGRPGREFLQKSELREALEGLEEELEPWT